MEVITVASAKKNSGKTTTALAIATALKDFSSKILLIDADAQGDLTTHFQKENGYEYWDRTIRQVMLGDLSLKEVVETFDNLSFISSELRLMNIDKEINNYTLNNILIKEDYDYCVIDTASNTGMMNLNSFIASDYIVLTSKLEAWPVEALDVMYAEVEKAIQLQDVIEKRLKKVIVLPTFYDENWMTEPYNLALHQGYSDLVSDKVIPREENIADTYDEYMKFIRKLLRVNYS
jgi:chromosome partitioning protein